MAKAFTKYHYIAAGISIIVIVFSLAMPAQPTPQVTQTIQIDIPPPAPVVVIDEAELVCMAKNIFFEARGESREGKVAVAAVTLNRVHSKRFPDTVCGVVKQAYYKPSWKTGKPTPIRNKCHFSWYCDGKSDEINYYHPDGTLNQIAYKNWITSFDIAKNMLMGNISDPTHGSTHYYNPKLANPYWSDHFEEVASVGNHVFLR